MARQRRATRHWHIGLALLLGLLACEAPPRSLEPTTQLRVITGRYSTVIVAGRSAEATPVTPAELQVPPQPSYDVAVQADSGHQLLSLQVRGPLVDLRAIEPGPTFLYGQRRVLHLRAETDGYRLEGVALRDGQVVMGSAEQGGLRFTLVGEGPIELLIAWREGTRLRWLSRRRLTVWTEDTLVTVTPITPVDQPLVIDVAGELAGWVRAELTLEGVRTGLLLGAGLAGGRVGLDGPQRGALLVHRPADLGPNIGVWLQATARRVGEAEPEAEIGQHISLQTTGVTLRFPSAPTIAPAPQGSPLGASLLPNGYARWGADPTAAWIALSLRSVGCGPAPWTITGDPALGHMQIPHPAAEVLTGSLLAVRAQRVEIGELDYTQTTGPNTPLLAQVPKVAARWGRRTTAGYWRGGDPSCPPDPHQGLYTVQSLDPNCAPGEAGQRALINRCGALIPLGPGPLTCATLRDAHLDPAPGVDGLSYTLRTDDDGLTLESPHHLHLHPTAPLVAHPLPALSGAWYRYQLTEQRHPLNADGTLGPAETAPQFVAEGHAESGPWVNFEATGEVHSAVPKRSFLGRLLRFDGVSGHLQIEDAACHHEARLVALSANEEALVLREVVMDQHGAKTWALILWRR